jgi:AhpD family alkylhydroperoxidase
MVDPATATGRAKTLLDGIRAKRGSVANMPRVLANSPAALGGYLSFGAALANGVLPAALRERIAIAVAETNGCLPCLPCLAAHTEFGAREGLDAAELEAARGWHSSDPEAAAALRFAAAVLRGHGHVDDAELAALRAAGLGDAAALEIVATVYVNVFTNAVNHVAGTPPSHPVPPPR